MKLSSGILIGLYATCLARTIAVPLDLSELTGVAHIDLERLLSATLPVRRQTGNETCPASVGSFPSPTSPSTYDLEKRNAFVKRHVSLQFDLFAYPMLIEMSMKGLGRS